MREHDHYLFYGDDISGDAVTLDDGEKNHAVSVLRITAGKRLRITTGKGVIYDCECVDIARQSMSCRIINKTTVPKIVPELTLLVGLPDRERFETILENAAALGVSRIIPLVTDHCRKPWWTSWEKSSARFKAKMIVSMKQCLYPYIPLLDAPTQMSKIIDACDKPLIIADQHGGKPAAANFSKHPKLSCLTGPPGGFSAEESKLLKSLPSITVNIAPTRLRTELAATVLCAMIIGGT